MGKASFIIYIAVALLLLFLLISRSSLNSDLHAHHARTRRLKIRSNFPFSPPADPHAYHDRPAAFDPLIADIELHREDREWEHHYFHTEPAPGHEAQPEWEDFSDAEDFLNDEGRFNVTNRLVLLFPRLDVDPADGFVSESELTQWNLQQSRRDALHRSQREMETHDRNRTGFVTFADYKAPSWVRNADNTSFGYDFGWWKEDHFNASDVDGDGRLNITEFHDFLHPADTSNPKLLLWLCSEEIRERDRDGDGKVNFSEFYHGLFSLVRSYEEAHNSVDGSDDSLDAPAKLLFSQLDEDGDRYLTAVELLPIIGKLHPSEHHYAKQQTEYIMHQADADKDGRLTLKEMIESPYVFYTAVFSENGDYELHDEFR